MDKNFRGLSKYVCINTTNVCISFFNEKSGTTNNQLARVIYHIKAALAGVTPLKMKYLQSFEQSRENRFEILT